MLTWIEALKKYNEKKGGKYVIPKKGTKEHAEVKAMMGKKEDQDSKDSKKEMPKPTR